MRGVLVVDGDLGHQPVERRPCRSGWRPPARRPRRGCSRCRAPRPGTTSRSSGRSAASRTRSVELRVEAELVDLVVAGQPAAQEGQAAASCGSHVVDAGPASLGQERSPPLAGVLPAAGSRPVRRSGRLAGPAASTARRAAGAGSWRRAASSGARAGAGARSPGRAGRSRPSTAAPPRRARAAARPIGMPRRRPVALPSVRRTRRRRAPGPRDRCGPGRDEVLERLAGGVRRLEAEHCAHPGRVEPGRRSGSAAAPARSRPARAGGPAGRSSRRPASGIGTRRPAEPADRLGEHDARRRRRR